MKININLINQTHYKEDIKNINFMNYPTPTRLMGKDSEKWRLFMNNKKNELENEDLYLYIKDFIKK